MITNSILFKLAICFVLTMLFSAVAMAREQRDAVWKAEKKPFRVVHEHSTFDVARSARFFNQQCLTTVDCLEFPLGGPVRNHSLAPKPDHRNLQERIADTFMMVTAYPGGTFLYNTVRAGLDLMLYSEDMTSIRYDNLKIGSQFGGKGRGFLKTGVFYNF